MDRAIQAKIAQLVIYRHGTGNIPGSNPVKGENFSAAFDVVDVPLLVTRLNILGLPDDVITLIKVWLTERFFYVDIDGVTSTLLTTWFGIIQGSILGPVLYAIFIAPLFEIEKLTYYADDGYVLAWNKDRLELISVIEGKLERIDSWLKMSGMKVNEAKTGLCLFHKRDTPPITIKLLFYFTFMHLHSVIKILKPPLPNLRDVINDCFLPAAFSLINRVYK